MNESKSLSEIIESLPWGFHDSFIHTMQLDWIKKSLTFELNVLIEAFRGDKGSIYRMGKIEITGLKAFAISEPQFKTFDVDADGAWVDMGTDFERLKPPEHFQISENSFWIFIRDYSCFIFATADNYSFEWTDEARPYIEP